MRVETARKVFTEKMEFELNIKAGKDSEDDKWLDTQHQSIPRGCIWSD